MDITKKLFELQDNDYGDFQCRLIPGTDRNMIIGVRIPQLRKLAKNYIKDKECDEFIRTLPHRYYDENMLHGLLLSEYKNFDECVHAVDRFLPFVDNWAVCDTMSPKIFGKYKDRLILKVREWISSSHTYTCRFGIGMLMKYYLDEDFKEEYLDLPAEIKSREYYVNMMIAWFFATALAKQWKTVIPYIEQNRLDLWVHNKTIQKARESYRISSEQKVFLNNLKR